MLHKCGQSQSEIVILGINCLLVFCTVKCYNKMCDIVDRLRERRSCSVHLPNVIHAVCEYVKPRTRISNEHRKNIRQQIWCVRRTGSLKTV